MTRLRADCMATFRISTTWANSMSRLPNTLRFSMPLRQPTRTRCTTRNMATRANIAGIARSGSSGSYAYSVIGSPNQPIAYVSWGDAARFANWLTNGQPTQAKGQARPRPVLIRLSGATSDAALNVSPATQLPNTLFRPRTSGTRRHTMIPAKAGPITGSIRCGPTRAFQCAAAGQRCSKHRAGGQLLPG